MRVIGMRTVFARDAVAGTSSRAEVRMKRFMGRPPPRARRAAHLAASKRVWMRSLLVRLPEARLAAAYAPGIGLSRKGAAGRRCPCDPERSHRESQGQRPFDAPPHRTLASVALCN